MAGVLGHQLKALLMGFDRHNLGIGPVMVGHHGKTTHVRPNIDDRADVVRTQIVYAVLVYRETRVQGGFESYQEAEGFRSV